MNIERLNEQFKNDFLANKNYHSLEKYVMSELLTPISDYYNAVEIVCKNLNLIKGLDLLFVATYLNSEYSMGYDNLLEILNSKINETDDLNKAIIYYLNAHNIICNNKKWKNDKECLLNLKKSVDLSKGFNFANNRFYLAQCVDTQTAKIFTKEYISNVTERHTETSLKNLPEEYWFSSLSFVEEFILGTSISEIVYKNKIENLTKQGLI